MVPNVEVPLGRHCNGSSSAILLVTALLSCSDSSKNVGHTNLFPVLSVKAWLVAGFFEKRNREMA